MGGHWGRRIPLTPTSETASILQMRTLSWDALNQGWAPAYGLKAFLGWVSLVLAEIES